MESNITIEIGRLLRAGTGGFIAGCRVTQLNNPSFGALVRAPQDSGLAGGSDYQIYGLIHDIRVDDDGLVRQLVTADRIDAGVIADNRVNRNVPLEMSVLAVGYRQEGRIFHLLPPRPPLSLDVIYLCGPEEIDEFTSVGRFGYFRHILRPGDLPVAELLAAHLRQAQEAHLSRGNPDWVDQATGELITLLRDDYSTLMDVLGALSDAQLSAEP
jgi:hypothetical protein